MIPLRTLRQLFLAARGTRQLPRCLASTPDFNPYVAKYAEKLKKLQQENPRLFEEKMEDLKKKVETKTKNSSEEKVQPEAFPRQTKEEIKIENIAELEKLSLDQLTEVWKARHADKNSICSTIQVGIFDTIVTRGQDFPTFVYPVPRGDGYQMFLAQIASGGVEAHFTPVAEFQRHQSEAPACLRLKYFTDFKQKLGIVLMAGEYDPKVIGPEHAQCLANQHQIYYGSSELRRKLLLWNFNKEPHSFNHELLIAEFEKSLGISSLDDSLQAKA